VISLAVAAAGWVGVSSPGDYAAIEFPPTPRHDLVTLQDDTANVVVYLRGSVSVVGFEFGRDRIALVEDAAGHNY
jgi:hypothetical protein